MTSESVAAISNGCNSASDHSGDSPRGDEPGSTAPLLEDWLYRGSSIVDSVVCKRWGALYKDALVTFRKANDPKPSKKLPLALLTVSDEVWSRNLKIRKDHRSTVWVLATGKFIEKQLFGFTLYCQKKDPLYVCFDELEVAKHWHQVTRQAICSLGKDPGSRESSSKNLLSRRKSWHKTGIEGAGTHSRKASDDMSHNWTPPKTINCPQTTDDGERMSPFANRAESFDEYSEPDGDFDLSEEIGAELQGSCPLAPFQRKWRSVQHVNGVAVYEENEPGGDGAKMVSLVVRSTPESCFKAVMRHAFETSEVIEHVDKYTTVLKDVVDGNWLIAPRELVLRRSWRLDADGSYIILVQGTTHEKAPAAGCREGWFAPVQAKIEAAGFIIAPVAPEFSSGTKHSTECLVTTVAKVDLAGWLSKKIWYGRLLTWSPMVDQYTTSAWLRPLVDKVIILRDMLEQDRFVKKPFETTVVRHEPEVEPAEESVSTDQDLDMQRTLSRPRSIRPASFTSPKSMYESAVLPTLATQEESNQEGVELDEQIERYGQGTLAQKYWSCPGTCNFRIRGPNYLVDRKKVPAQPPIFALAAVDIVKVDRPVNHIAPYLPSLKASDAPFTFMLNIMVPSVPQLSLVISWAADYTPSPLTPTPSTASNADKQDRVSSPPSVTEATEDEEAESEQENTFANPFDLCMARFLAGDDTLRNGKFKLIPKIPEGSWVIKQSVGTTPVILGRKLQTKYFRGDGYFEMDIDIGSSSVAASVVSLVQGATKSLVIDMGVLFEGQASDELPEQLLGSVRLDHMDLSTAPYLDVEKGKVFDKKPGK